MDDFLRALDVGMLKRSLATKFVKSLNGQLKIVIHQAGNDIKFTTIGPNNPDGTTNEFIIGKSDNINENAFLGKMKADLHWELSADGRCVLCAEEDGGGVRRLCVGARGGS